MELRFQTESYIVKTEKIGNQELTYRSYEKLPYVTRPVDADLQVMNIYVPECYYLGEERNGYHLKNAPIFVPNAVGGYMPGCPQYPEADSEGNPNTIAKALLHGYVVVSSGIRGRGTQDASGKYAGYAPAAICDYKAVIRYLRSNRAVIPGDTEKIISNGTSAGGALSALLGSTGNHPDYEGYLREMGAAEARDDILAASCYCPITNLDHADMAYEWEFNGLWDFHRVYMKASETPGGEPCFVDVNGTVNEEQKQMSEELRSMFPEYVKSLGLKDAAGNDITISEAGGSLQDFVCNVVKRSAQKELDRGADLSNLEWLSIDNGRVVDMDYRGYIAFRTRMKEVPAFDSVQMDAWENELFGNSEERFCHFTPFAQQHNKKGGSLADAQQVKTMNPMEYIGDKDADVAPFFRIRHGAIDRDTSLFISALLTLKLREAGTEADLEYPWGKWHMGDYDLEELFAWIDRICKNEKMSK